MGSGSAKPVRNSKVEPEAERNVPFSCIQQGAADPNKANPTAAKNTSNIKSGDNKTNTTLTQDDPDNQDHDLVPVLSKVATIDEDKGIVAEPEVSFAEFPTHVTLRSANEKAAKKRKSVPKNKDGILQHFPSHRRKVDIFRKENYQRVDAHAEAATEELLSKPVADVVKYLNTVCKSELDKARAYFYWLTSRDLNKLPKSSPNLSDDAVLIILSDIKKNENFNAYTQLYIDLCKAGGLQAVEIKGKVRTKCDLDMVSEVDDFVNTWVAVVINNEWRLIDVQFAAVSVSGGAAGDWQLIDDTGKKNKTEKDTKAETVFKSDDYYFLTDPEEFIYNHRPLDDAWQLLARPVTFSEYQKMAFLRSSFFNQNLTIGDQTKYILDADDGEKEIIFRLPVDGKHRFSYKLWRSLKGSKNQDHGGFELSQFVMIQQKEGTFKCKVIFPIAGDYKLDIFGRSETDTSPSYSLVCTYIIKVEEAKENWTAFPKNPRNEWGCSHEMIEMGLVPSTHPHATIETDDGKLDIRFKCTKDPVDCQIKLRQNKDTKGVDLARNIIFRQNENKEVAIYGKLPKSGYYAMDIYAKKWAADSDKFPVVATYLIASSAACLDKQPYPRIQKQLTGQTTENIKLKVTPKSHKESIINLSDESSLKLDLDTPLPVTFTCGLTHHSDDGKQDDMSDYAFKTQSKSAVQFDMRFPRAGVYTFDIFGKPEGSGSDLPQIYNYVINVAKGRLDSKPFPKSFNGWGAGCDVSLTEAEVDEGTEKELTVTAPGAEEVAVITADGEWAHLSKGKSDTFSGKINTGPAGKMQIFSQAKGSENFSALLEYEVKSKKQAEEAEKKRIKKEKEEKEREAMKQKVAEEKQKEREQEFEKTKTELNAAIQARDSNLLKKAIAKVENNNYTGRLEKEYTKAKEIKKSVDRMTKLREMVLTIDQKTMAIIRSYKSPPPIVHATMRAAFLILGNTLKETKEWKRCQALCNSIELNKRIRGFSIKSVTKDNAKKAKNMLDPIRLEEVQQISEGATCFYLWTVGMSEEVLFPV